MVKSRDIVEKMIQEADVYISDTKDMLHIMELAGEDISEERKMLEELSGSVERYREALKNA